MPETTNGAKSGPSANIEKAAAALNIPVVAVAFDLEKGTIEFTPRDELAKAKAAAASGNKELPSNAGSDEALFLHTSGTTSRFVGASPLQVVSPGVADSMHTTERPACCADSKNPILGPRACL